MFKFTHGICVFTLAAAGLYAQTNMPVTVTHTTGLVGIAEGQTAQLNALNPDTSASATAAVACTGLLSFIGEDGTVLKTKTVVVSPGAGQHVDLDSVLDLALALDTRKQIRATITITAAAPTTTGSTTSAVKPVCRLIGTLEIFNTLDGHTLVTLGTVHEIPGPVATPGT
jgi:hypothetical protein